MLSVDVLHEMNILNRNLYRATLSFPSESIAVHARGQLTHMGFKVSAFAHDADTDRWVGTATVRLNKNLKTLERVRNVLEIAVPGLEGTYLEQMK
jgi:hypothetical protein